MDLKNALIMFLLAQVISLVVYIWKQMNDKLNEQNKEITRMKVDASNDRLKYVKNEALEPIIDERIELHKQKCENDLMNSGRISPKRKKSET